MNKPDVMQACLDAINANDRDRIMSFFTEQSVFDNVPMGAVTGRSAIWEVFAQVHDIASEVDWETHRLKQAPGGTIYSENTDRYKLNGKWAEFRCAGIHEINDDGKITQ